MNELAEISKEVVKDIVAENIKSKEINELFKEYIGKTKVEKYQEESTVLHYLMEGKDSSAIAKILKEKYPESNFKSRDVENFLVKSEEAYEFLKKDKNNVARRYFESKAQCVETIASLALFLERIILDLKEKGDYVNVINATKALNTTLSNYMEIEGMKRPSIMPNATIINFNEAYTKLRERAHQANFKVHDVSFTTTGSETKYEDQDEGTDSI